MNNQYYKILLFPCQHHVILKYKVNNEEKVQNFGSYNLPNKIKKAIEISKESVWLSQLGRTTDHNVASHFEKY